MKESRYILLLFTISKYPLSEAYLLPTLKVTTTNTQFKQDSFPPQWPLHKTYPTMTVVCVDHLPLP